MSCLSAVFRPGHKALIAYVTVGYPTVEATLRVVPLLAESGCDLVELGIPFSDPLADGATIQQASFRALQNGVTPRQCLEVARQLGQTVTVPLVFMTYYNPVFHYGLETFCDACAGSGVSGLIIPDLPPDEGAALEGIARAKGIDLIYLLAPTSTDQRVKLVSAHSRGFIYLVSLAGVTGARASLPPQLADFVGRVRRVATQPLCVGFGISTPEQAAEVARLADGVIIGSRILQLMAGGDDAAVGGFIRRVRQALDEGRA
ncbi:MAG: tryptophan synthase subunit alpha [Chloroflexota bacterium]